MNIYRKKLLWKVLLLIFAVVIGLGSLIYTHDLVDSLKEEERKKAEQWADATRRLVTSDDFEFLFSIIEDNTTVPVILIDEEESIISQRNLPAAFATDTLAMVRELKRMAKRNDPISIELPNGLSTISTTVRVRSCVAEGISVCAAGSYTSVYRGCLCCLQRLACS